eukprot:CAMPEP_0113310162 /NCGR_PEP_ID=MMETSP0010_2-20120614/7917_1 /TAXON_ID=216773 ORGANISM="Corethron hystrix, Strain 308" /NCGR_SAMPLE_ID=MMETSP0010_2 /ASSEMBLY_ACC=CAM_ASM_000155 /LENGTH=90 /DNA_ID=CAMNT_0000165561 /DNA_START=437 /DNA_END=709 /DNA_ORIENTATION=+ /assembly_acc=CAM_ASM_000155
MTAQDLLEFIGETLEAVLDQPPRIQGEEATTLILVGELILVHGGEVFEKGEPGLLKVSFLFPVPELADGILEPRAGDLIGFVIGGDILSI